MNQLRAVQSKTEIFSTTTTTTTTSSIGKRSEVLPWVNDTPNKGKEEEKEILQPLTDLVVSTGGFLPSREPLCTLYLNVQYLNCK